MRIDPVRTPPRRRAYMRPVRLVTIFCIALMAFSFGSGRADAYPCGTSADSQRSAFEDCRKPSRRAAPDRPQAGDANLVSLTIFVGVLAAVLLVPLNYSRRPGSDPE